MGFFSFFCFLFTTQVEQFWGFYSYLVRPGDLTGHSDIHLFKDGIKPMWEVGYLQFLNPLQIFYIIEQWFTPQKYSVFRVTWLYSSCYTTKKNWRKGSALNLWIPGWPAEGEKKDFLVAQEPKWGTMDHCSHLQHSRVIFEEG